MPYSTTKGYPDIKAYYYLRFTSTLISDNSILTNSKSKANDFSSQTIKNNLPTSLSKEYMTINSHHLNNRDKEIVIHRILIDVQCYLNPLIVPYLH